MIQMVYKANHFNINSTCLPLSLSLPCSLFQSVLSPNWFPFGFVDVKLSISILPVCLFGQVDPGRHRARVRRKKTKIKSRSDLVADTHLTIWQTKVTGTEQCARPNGRHENIHSCFVQFFQSMILIITI